MTQTPRFCTQCGAALSAGAGFCAQCGAPVKQPTVLRATQRPPAVAPPAVAPPPPPPAARPRLAQPAPPVAPPTAAGTEPILSIILGLQRQKGFLGMGIDNYSLIITPSRLVFAYLDSKAMQAYGQRARHEAKAEGKGLLRQWGAQLGWLALLERDLQASTPDQILAQSPNSFFIPNATVSRIRIRRKTDPEHDSTTHVVLTINATSGKHKFQIPTSFKVTPQKLKQRLRQTLGTVVR